MGFNSGFKGLMKLHSFTQIFEKYSNIKLQENLSSWSRVVPCGRTDGHDEANSRLSQFCELAQKKKTKNAIQKHPVYVFMPFTGTNFIIIFIITIIIT